MKNLKTFIQALLEISWKLLKKFLKKIHSVSIDSIVVKLSLTIRVNKVTYKWSNCLSIKEYESTKTIKMVILL